LSFPGARLLHFTDRSVADIDYEQTEHYRLTRDFLNNRERYFRLLFEE
jgi:predicted ATPase